MKRLLLTILISLSLVGYAYAQVDLSDTLEKLPALKQGVGFSFLDSDFCYLSTVELAKWNKLSLEGGMLWKNFEGHDTDKPNLLVAVLSYNIVNLKELGVELPVLDLINANIGLFAGYGRTTLDTTKMDANCEFDIGASLTLIDVRF